MLSASHPIRKARGGERGTVCFRSYTKVGEGGWAACRTLIYIFVCARVRDSAWGAGISYEWGGAAAAPPPPPPQAYAGSGAAQRPLAFLAVILSPLKQFLGVPHKIKAFSSFYLCRIIRARNFFSTHMYS